MTPTFGLLNRNDRDVLTRAADAVALLPVPGCRDLAAKMNCIAQTNQPHRDMLVSAAALGTHVRLSLLAEASPERWVDSIGDMPGGMDMVGGLIAERQGQAALVQSAVAICERVMDRAPVTV